jgi:signal transduction histidine kinase
MGHEIRGPLTSIQTAAEILKRRRRHDPRLIEAILAEVERLNRLIGDLLFITRLEQGQLQLWPEETDLVLLVREIVAQARRTTRLHRLRVQAPRGPVRGSWDRDRLAQVVQNLLSNAIKYSPDGGEILIRVHGTEDEAQVLVKDGGLGIAANSLPHLFDRFYRADETALRARGLGGGLFVSKLLVQAHGGAIRAESPGPGRGSSFIFILPLHPPLRDQASPTGPTTTPDC